MGKERDRGSPEMHVPLRLLMPGYGGGVDENDRQLAVYNPPPPVPVCVSRFSLPEGWEVEEIPRADATRVDRYYYETSTGNKFRSLREVERYITGEVYTPRRSRSKTLRIGYRGSRGKSQNSVYRKMVVSGGKFSQQSQNSVYRKMVISGGKMLKLEEDEDPSQYQMAIVPARNNSTSSSCPLPDGWVVEEVPRNKPHGYVDRYYYEPGTGRKFRSLLSVRRHLAEQNESSTLSETLAELKEYNLPLSKAFKIGSHVKSSNSLWKNTIPREKVQSATFNSPPLKINWVIASAKGDSWNPFIGGSLVPESVKQQWSKRFMMTVSEGSYSAPDI
ncbi:methyl-CpG-binding domain-containing protein 7 isoform X1 [Daucus carota subsp. sativus]|uniref:methyl-CpG-binding domain-containing protein 7 isoform X1 n=1 Tax=Daucus carota subsp. sativus TaxID=79200 RepID=UPI0007EF2B56|nr:PREDICTED: methyl-CpG-binding domain-containing protein 7-like isoform X1 [Daucus carota subsp. sativus]